MRRSRLWIGRGISVALAGLMAAGSASALGAPKQASAATSGSIVYLKNGRVWIAHADGTHARQFTLHRFNWSSPSEANNGTIVVAGGRARINQGGTDADPSSEIYRFRPDGNQIGRAIPTWGSYSSPACPTYPPLSVEVSPDATKIAYGIWECASADYTALWTPATSTRLNFPHQQVGQMDSYEPHWVNRSTFLVSHVGQTITDSQARWYTHGVSQADDTGRKGWNDSSMTGTGAQAVISRAGDKLAVFEDDAADWTNGKPRNVRLWLYTGRNIPNNWTKRCVIKLPAAQITKPLYLHPSFSPDGKRLIWAVLLRWHRAARCCPPAPARLRPAQRSGDVKAAVPLTAANAHPGPAHHVSGPGPVSMHPYQRILCASRPAGRSERGGFRTVRALWLTLAHSME